MYHCTRSNGLEQTTGTSLCTLLLYEIKQHHIFLLLLEICEHGEHFWHGIYTPHTSIVVIHSIFPTHAVCRRRYKTASSLKAHHTQYHAGEPFPAILEEKVPVILPPPPNLQGKEVAKPNPYCDFCLGDSTGNKKTSKPEKMVSCADCGRSGKRGGAEVH